MNALHTIIILLAAFLAVFFQSSFGFFGHFFGAQIDLLPVLVVYASLTTSLISVALVALAGGLLFDSISANPLGVSAFPLFIIGFAIHRFHGLLLREHRHAQFVLGVIASVLAPLFTLLILLSGQHNPLIGWGTFWQFIFMGASGGVLTPICFWILDRVTGALSYKPVAQTTFRPDRQIKRGRGRG
ncbi:MAG: rod shape-determining protein MreD [Verrucomicrobiota bacterium]